MKKFFEIGCSGIIGAILTMAFQYFVLPQSFTFVYNGNKVVVTESTYMELATENDNLQKKLTAVQKELDEMKAQVESVQSKENVRKIVQEATDYWNHGEYVQALTLLKNDGIQSDNMKILYENFSDEYCLIVLKEVDELLAGRDYEEAKNILTEAKTLVSDKRTLESKLEDIENNQPVKLSDLKISASRFFEINQDEPVMDSVGNRYPIGNIFIARAEGDKKYGYATFYLGKKYEGLSGSIAVSDESENRSDTQLEGWVEIYSKQGEDYTQLYSSPVLSRTVSPIEVPDLSLSDAEWLEIRYYNKANYFSLANGYHSLKVILSNFMVYSGY